jgi:DNA-binding NarL/FixJ family response regulator
MDRNAKNEALIEAVWDVMEANEASQAVLAANAALLRQCALRLEGGEHVVEIVRSAPGAPGRMSARAAEDRQEKARARFRTLLIAGCMAAGMSRREIASNMGFSPQLVSRYARAAQEMG